MSNTPRESANAHAESAYGEEEAVESNIDELPVAGAPVLQFSLGFLFLFWASLNLR